MPELAVEVVSPTNTADEIAEKLEEYFQVGVQRVWVVYPRQSKVYVYTSPAEVRVLVLGNELDGGDLLPGFRLPLTSLFEQPGQPAQRRQNGRRRDEWKPRRDDVGRLCVGSIVRYHELRIRQLRQIAGGIVDSGASVAKQAVSFDFHAHQPVRTEKAL